MFSETKIVSSYTRPFSF